MENEKSANHVKSLVFPFFIGGMIGAGVAFLFAPKSGREARQMIKDAAGKAGERVGQVKKKAVSVVEKGKGLFQEKKAVLAKAIDAGKEAYIKEKESFVKAQ